MPISSSRTSSRDISSKVPTPAPVFAAEGGEDYELLAALPPAFGEAAAAAPAMATGVPLPRIGAVVEGSGVRLWHERCQVRLAGYDHFA